MTRSLDCTHDWDEAERSFRPLRDKWGETSVRNVFVVGDAGGIIGARASAFDGEIAAVSISTRLGRLSEAERETPPIAGSRANRIAHLSVRPLLQRLYKPREDIVNPPDAVIICRCENVSAGQIREAVLCGSLGPEPDQGLCPDRNGAVPGAAMRHEHGRNHCSAKESKSDRSRILPHSFSSDACSCCRDRIANDRGRNDMISPGNSIGADDRWEELDALPAWTFALALYGTPEAGPNFLVLQDLCTVDVTFLIFALYLTQARGKTPGRPLLQALQEEVADWRARVVAPIRRVRQDLKGMEERGGHPLVGNLRQTIKAAELRAEQLELDMLDRWTMRNADGFPFGTPQFDENGVEGLIADVIEIHRQTSVPQPEPEPVRRAIAAIASAYSALALPSRSA